MDSNGITKWGPFWDPGIIICSESEIQFCYEICTDGSGGAIIVWEDNRTTGFGNWSLYSQKVTAIGVLAWIPEVVVCDGTEDIFPPFYKICSDDNEGTIIVWSDNRSGNKDVYSQRINKTGDFKWTENGKEICTKTNDQEPQDICYDGFEGAIITWRERTISDNGDIYTQRINSTGDLKWDSDGLTICDNIGRQINSYVSNDGTGGAYIVWEDEKGGSEDIYAQYVNSSGSPQWTTNGIAICNENDRQQDDLIISDGSGGAIIAWNDNRKGKYDYYDDVYASRIGPNGIVITPEYYPPGPIVGDDDDDDKDKEGEAIPGYDVYLITIAIFISIIVIHFALRKNFQKYFII